MDELTDAQREILKTLPVAFLTKLRAAVVRERELDEQWAVEEERVARLREMIQDWKTKHEQAYATAMASIQQRLQDSQAAVSQSIAHVDKTKQLQLTNLEEQISRRKGEIE